MSWTFSGLTADVVLVPYLDQKTLCAEYHEKEREVADG